MNSNPNGAEQTVDKDVDERVSLTARLDLLQEQVKSYAKRFEDYKTYLVVALSAVVVVFTLAVVLNIGAAVITSKSVADESNRVAAERISLRESINELELRLSDKIDEQLGLAQKEPRIELMALSGEPLSGNVVKSMILVRHASTEQTFKFPFLPKEDGAYLQLRIPFLVKNTGTAVLDGFFLTIYTNDPLANLTQSSYEEPGSDEKGFSYYSAILVNDKLPPGQSTHASVTLRLPNDFGLPSSDEKFPVMLKSSAGNESAAAYEFYVSITRTMDIPAPAKYENDTLSTDD